MPNMKQRFTRFTSHATVLALASLVSATASAQDPQHSPAPRGNTGAWQMPSQTGAQQTYTAPQQQPAQPQQPAPYYAPYPPYPAYQPPAPVTPPAATAPDDGEETDEDPDSPPNFDLMVGTQVPLSIGVIAHLELPGRILLQGELGWMPRAYGSAINGVVSSIGAYDNNIRDLVDGALEDALVVRLSGGWRPFPSAGFEIFGGYTHIALSGSVSAETVAAIAGGGFASGIEAMPLSDVSISSGLHNFHVGLGWRWVAFEHLVLRVSLAYTQTVGSSSSIETPEEPGLGALATPFIDAELDAVYGDYVKLPLLGLAAGYRF